MSSMNPAVGNGVRSVLIAYDFSEASHKPLHHAIAIARHFEAQLYLGYVVSSTGYGIAGPGASQLAYEGSQRDVRQLEANLLKSGALSALQYELIVRKGNVWEQLECIVGEKHVDAVVVGTHARAGMVRLALGSVAEQVFRQADCLVLTVAPGSKNSLMETQGLAHVFLLATDFGPASLQALTHAASFANRFRAKLVVLHVLPAQSTTGDLIQQAEMDSRRQFQRLILPNVPNGTVIEFVVKFGSTSGQILQACHTLKANLLILGLNRTEHVGTRSHSPWSIAYKIVCGASCPVLTMKAAARQSVNS